MELDGILEVASDRLYFQLEDFPSGAVGWIKLDMSDCDMLIDGVSWTEEIALGEDGVYVSTFSNTDELYRVPRE